MVLLLIECKRATHPGILFVKTCLFNSDNGMRAIVSHYRVDSRGLMGERIFKEMILTYTLSRHKKYNNHSIELAHMICVCLSNLHEL